LIADHHEGYIPWSDFERNQTLIADNANGKRFMSRGAIRRGGSAGWRFPLRAVRT
jgi:hypothetical protein